MWSTGTLKSTWLLHGALTLLFVHLLDFRVQAQKPLTEPLEGTVDMNYVYVGACKASEMTLKYRLSTTVGEPTVYTTMKWTNDSGTDVDCLSQQQFSIFLHVVVIYTDYWIPTEGSAGMVVPKGDGTWAMNPLAGSPNWDNLLLTSEPHKADGSDASFLDGPLAKGAWGSGMLRVVGAVVLSASDGSSPNGEENAKAIEEARQDEIERHREEREEKERQQAQEEEERRERINGNSVTAAPLDPAAAKYAADREKAMADQAASQQLIDAIPAYAGMINDIASNSARPAAYLSNSFGLEIIVGLAGGQIPVMMNSSSSTGYINPYSYVDVAAGFPGLTLVSNMWFVRGPRYGIGGFGGINYATSLAAGSEVSLSDFFYGGRALWGSKHLKAVLEYGAGSKSASSVLDSDVSSAQFGIAFNSNIISSGSATFAYTKLGYGLMVEFNNEERAEQKSLTFLYYNERPEFLSDDFPATHTAKLTFRDAIDISFEYSFNYPIAGDMKYPLDRSEGTDKDLWFFTVGYPFGFVTPHKHKPE